MKIKNYQKLLKLVKKAHAHQTRNDGSIPYWVHCHRVSRLLEHIFSITKEGSVAEREAVILAALGHDLYEDTDIEREFIIQNFGHKVDSLIFEMTNENVDKKIFEYCKKLRKNSESSLLIKLADLSDNMIGGAYAVHENGRKWSKEFLWPVTHQQWLAISKLKFNRFPKTALYLKSLVDFGNHSLQIAVGVV